MGTRTFGAIVMLVLGGCASYNAPLADRSQPVEKAKVETRFTPGSAEGGIPVGTRYQVQAGDTLYGIAFRFELNPEGLAAANRIAPFATLKTGQTLVLSEAKPPTNPIKAATPKPATKSVTSKPAAVTPGSWQWQWPVDGRVLGGFSTQQRFSRSVRLKGELGDPVRAAAPGRVVYAGDGLVGLGNLVLIRHDDTWLSAYGHNQSIQVQVNQMVRGGQDIARLGATGTDEPKLHFEIRRNGEPVNPVDVLPSR